MLSRDVPTVARREGVTLVSLTDAHDSLDEVHIQRLTDPLLSVAESADPPLVVIDLSQTTMFGSAFLALLIRMWRCLASRNGRFGLAGLTPHCLEVVKATHLHEVWETFETPDEAIRAMH